MNSDRLRVVTMVDPDDPNSQAKEPPHQEDPRVGEVIDGRYVLMSRLGEGGMGVVYKAKHKSLGKPVAVKVLRAEVSTNEQIVGRFQQEAQSASAIGNEHIIDISDFGYLPDGSAYFVMEFLDGRSLSHVLVEEQPLRPERCLRIAIQLSQALGAAHDRGIVHRDLKPDNVMLISRDSSPDFVKVLDFGIAKVAGASSKLTNAGEIFGTPHYMSPEQCAGKAVDHRTDIYALGVILYEMSSGQVPFDADDLMGILTKHIYEAPIPPREMKPPVDVPSALEAIIMKCLAKTPDMRYQSMAELRADLGLAHAGKTPSAVVDSVAGRRSSARPIANYGHGGGVRKAAEDTLDDVGIAGLNKKGRGMTIAIAAVVIALGVGVWFYLGKPDSEGKQDAVNVSTPKKAPNAMPATTQPITAEPAVPKEIENTPSATSGAEPTEPDNAPSTLEPTVREKRLLDDNKPHRPRGPSRKKNNKPANAPSGGGDVVDPWS